MIAPPTGLRVSLACGVTDMRKGMVGLAMLVQRKRPASLPITHKSVLDGLLAMLRGR